MIRTILSLIVLALLMLSPAQALRLAIFDRDLTTPLGVAESNEGRLHLQLLQDASGPVTVLVEDDSGRVSSLAGLIQGGQLLVGQPPQPLARFLAARGMTYTVQTRLVNGARERLVLPNLRAPSSPGNSGNTPAQGSPNPGQGNPGAPARP